MRPNRFHYEFIDCIKDLIASEQVRDMGNFRQHNVSTRLEHSVFVAYLSFLFCRIFGLDFRAAARGGLLHDFYLYNWWEKGSHKGRHTLTHPKVALANAQHHFYINPIEKDIIAKHMWPFAASTPKYKESMVICFMDKFCAFAEMVGLYSMYKYFLRKKRPESKAHSVLVAKSYF